MPVKRDKNNSTYIGVINNNNIAGYDGVVITLKSLPYKSRIVIILLFLFACSSLV